MKNIKSYEHRNDLKNACHNEIFNRLLKLEDAVNSLAEKSQDLIKDCTALGFKTISFLLENGFLDLSLRLSYCEEFLLNESERQEKHKTFMGCEVTK